MKTLEIDSQVASQILASGAEAPIADKPVKASETITLPGGRKVDLNSLQAQISKASADSGRLRKLASDNGVTKDIAELGASFASIVPPGAVRKLYSDGHLGDKKSDKVKARRDLALGLDKLAEALNLLGL